MEYIEYGDLYICDGVLIQREKVEKDGVIFYRERRYVCPDGQHSYLPLVEIDKNNKPITPTSN